MLLCSGDRLGFNQEDDDPATNFEIVSAFSLASTLEAHCVINTAGKELFVAASSCRNAKIIAVYRGHLEAISCGRCSRIEAEDLFKRAPSRFQENLENFRNDGEPHVLWQSGYIADEGRRAAKERMEKLFLRKSE